MITNLRMDLFEALASTISLVSNPVLESSRWPRWVRTTASQQPSAPAAVSLSRPSSEQESREAGALWRGISADI